MNGRAKIVFSALFASAVISFGLCNHRFAHKGPGYTTDIFSLITMLDSFKQRIHYSRKIALLRLARLLGGERLLLALARVFYRLKVEGESTIPKSGGCLAAFNHVSTMADGLVYLVVHRRRPDAYLFTQGLVSGVIVGLLDAIGISQPVERVLPTDNRPQLSVDYLLRARQILLDGGCVVIAPEGELTWDGRLQSPLAPGTAWLALRTGAPIIPIISRGGYDVQPVWQMDKTRLTGRIRIRAGQPLVLCEQPLERVNEAALRDANQQLWEAMAGLLAD